MPEDKPDVASSPKTAFRHAGLRVCPEAAVFREALAHSRGSEWLKTTDAIVKDFWAGLPADVKTDYLTAAKRAKSPPKPKKQTPPAEPVSGEPENK